MQNKSNIRSCLGKEHKKVHHPQTASRCYLPLSEPNGVVSKFDLLVIREAIQLRNVEIAYNVENE